MRRRPSRLRHAVPPWVPALLLMWGLPLSSQEPVQGEVRQIVTFTLLPGEFGPVSDIYGDELLPVYRTDAAMRSLRLFREVESPVPVDLVVVRGFQGMAGMDASNRYLRSLEEDAGPDIGAIYGEIADRSSGHTDEFVEMIPELGRGDPTEARLTAFVRYRVVPGQDDAFERAVGTTISPWEEAAGVASATGRFLLADGWDYLRILGFDSLDGYQRYWDRLHEEADYERLMSLTDRRQEILLSSMEEFRIR